MPDGLLLALLALAAQPLWADPSGPATGGLYGELEAAGGERHHAITRKVLADAGYDIKCGPAIRMETTDHQKTESWGGWDTAKEYRARQEEILADKSLSERERFRRIMEMDIENVKTLFPGKYDAAIEQMLERYEQLRDLLDASGADWKSLTSASGCEPQSPPGGGGGAGDPAPAPALSLTARQSQLHAFMQWDYPEQQMSGEPGTPPEPVQAIFDLAATRHPDVDVAVQVTWGDGSTTNVTVPAGTGTFSTSLSHYYAAPPEQGGKGSYLAELRYAYQQAVIPPGWEDEHPVAAALIGIETC